MADLREQFVSPLRADLQWRDAPAGPKGRRRRRLPASRLEHRPAALSHASGRSAEQARGRAGG